MVRNADRLKHAAARAKRGRNVRPRTERSGTHAGRYIILTALLIALGWFAVKPAVDRVTALPVFIVSRVTVEGAEHLDRSRILETADIAPGINIFRADLKRASDRLRKEFAAEDFTVYRRIPDTIVIRVRERKPVALISGGKLIGVDANGVPLPHIGASMSDSLPIITGINGGESSLADPAVRHRLLSGLKLLDAIARQSPGMYKRISEINVSSLSDMGFNLIDTGLEVIIGESGWGEKLPNLERVINQVTGRMDSVKTVDMRFGGERIFVKKFRPAAENRNEPSRKQGDGAPTQ